MANADYTIRAGAQGFCPVGYLNADITQLQTAVVMTGYTSPIADGIRLGMAAMIDEEIVEVVARSGNNLTLARGCCDTVPALHSAGAAIWFFDGSIASDRIEYAGTETIGVKVLPRISSGAEVPIEASPPAGLTFNLRFARPYPPGLVEVNGDPWFTDPIPFNLDVPTLVITWAHRDRITQQDQLVDHIEADVGPEPGTTYELRVYKADDTLLRTVVGLTGTTWSYEFADAALDFSAAGSDYPGYITLCSRRDGLASFQQYRIDFTFESSTTPVVSDPDYANVILLVQGGADASLTINDLSTYASTATIVNYAEFDDAHPVFGSNSIKASTLSSAIGSFSSSGSTSRFGRATGDIFTIECYVYIQTLENFSTSSFAFSWWAAGLRILEVGTHANTAGAKLRYRQSSETALESVSISAGALHFLQLNINADNTFTLDLDGVLAYSGTNGHGIGDAGTFEFFAGAVNASGSPSAPTTAVWTSPLRVTKGVARARGSVPTEPFIGDITGGPDVVEETFTVTTSIVTQPAGAAIAMNLTQLAAPTSAGSAYVAIFYCPTALQADPLPDGTTLSVSFGIGLSQSVAVLTVLSYTAVGATSKATAMAALIAQANAATALSSRGLTASANSYLGSPGMQIQGPDGFKLHSSFGIMDPGVQAPVFTQLSNLLVAEFTLGSPAVGSALNQLVTATLSGTPVAGDQYTVTLNGVAYSHTAASGATLNGVATALAALIDAASAYAASAVGPVITIDGVTPTNVFTYSSSAEALFAF